MSEKVCRRSTAYAIRCESNGKVFVNCCHAFENRVNDVFWELRRRSRNNALDNASGLISHSLQEDFDKYGEAGFRAYILESGIKPPACSKTVARWIAEYNATDPGRGYNLTTRPYCSLCETGIEVVAGLPPMHKTEDANGRT